MNKIKIIILAGFAVVALSLGGAVIASAQDFRSGETVTVSQSDHIDGTLFAAGTTVTIDSEVNGDVYCAGQTVTISGTVHGDVLCAAQTLTLKGVVDGDVRLAGQVVVTSAEIGGSATIGAQTFTQDATGKIARDAVIGANDVTVQGTIGRDATIGADNVTLAGVFGRDINAQAMNVRLAADARVGGAVDYTSDNAIVRAEGSQVSGEVTQYQPIVEDRTAPVIDMSAVIGWYIYWFVALLVIALVFILVMPRIMRGVTDQAITRPWWVLLAGFVANMALPFVMIALCVTIVGIPLAALLLFLGVAVFLVSGIFFSFYIGRLIVRGATHPVLVMLVGASLVIAVSFIPFLNILVFLAATWFGSGMILLEVFKRVPSANKPATKK
jgi:cytoskeletal protein CcmA (bactofilin family)